MSRRVVRSLVHLVSGRTWLVAALAPGLLVATAIAGCATTSPAEPAAEPSVVAASTAATVTGGEFTITGTTWQWESTTIRASGETTTAPDPTKYTVVFGEDGSLGGQADCNQYSGAWTQEDGGLSIQLETTTMAYCGEGSLDQEFVQSLAMMVAGGPDGTGKLALESAGGERRMVFLNGGPAAGK